MCLALICQSSWNNIYASAFLTVFSNQGRKKINIFFWGGGWCFIIFLLFWVKQLLEMLFLFLQSLRLLWFQEQSLDPLQFTHEVSSYAGQRLPLWVSPYCAGQKAPSMEFTSNVEQWVLSVECTGNKFQYTSTSVGNMYRLIHFILDIYHSVNLATSLARFWGDQQF